MKQVNTVSDLATLHKQHMREICMFIQSEIEKGGDPVMVVRKVSHSLDMSSCDIYRFNRHEGYIFSQYFGNHISKFSKGR